MARARVGLRPASEPATGAVVRGDTSDPTAPLLAGWLSSRLDTPVPLESANPPTGTPGVAAVALDLSDGGRLSLSRGEDGRGLLRRVGTVDVPPSMVPMPDRGVGDLLAEELRRLDADEPYADALGAACGTTGLSDRPAKRSHVWRDPALEDAAQAAGPA